MSAQHPSKKTRLMTTKNNIQEQEIHIPCYGRYSEFSPACITFLPVRQEYEREIYEGFGLVNYNSQRGFRV